MQYVMNFDERAYYFKRNTMRCTANGQVCYARFKSVEQHYRGSSGSAEKIYAAVEALADLTVHTWVCIHIDHKYK